MDRLEQRLRAARPPVPELGPPFAAQVTAEIARRGLRVRPLWVLRAPLWAGRAAALLTLAAAVVTLNGAAYELRASGALELLHFGASFLAAFLANVPYDLLLTALALGGAAAWLLRHARPARVPVAWTLLLSYGLTGAGGLALAGSGLNESLQSSVLEESAGGTGSTALGWFYGERAVYRRPDPRFHMGRVVALEGRRARLLTPLGEEEEVDLPPGFSAQVGEPVRLIAAPDGGPLRALTAQRCNPAAVEGYFQHHRMMMRGRGGHGSMPPGPMPHGMMQPGGGMMDGGTMGGPGMGPGGMGGPGGGGPPAR
jgi:hypothetical protein